MSVSSDLWRGVWSPFLCILPCRRVVTIRILLDSAWGRLDPSPEVIPGCEERQISVCVLPNRPLAPDEGSTSGDGGSTFPSTFCFSCPALTKERMNHR